MSESIDDSNSIEVYEPSFNDIHQVFISHNRSHRKKMVDHQIDSFNEFINNDMKTIIQQFNPVRFKVTNTRQNIDLTTKDIGAFENVITFTDVHIKRPHHSNNDGSKEFTLPQKARDKNLTYQSMISVDIIHEIYAIKKDGTRDPIPFKQEVSKDVTLGRIPIMLHSSACNLYRRPYDALVAAGEDPNDQGGYFIIAGNEKVVIAKERVNMNHIYFYDNSAKSVSPTLYTSMIKSQIEGKYECAHIATVKMDRKFRISLALNPGFQKKDIPIFIMFRALGIVTDKAIIEYIIYDFSEATMISILHPSMFQGIRDTDLPNNKDNIVSQEDALLYIANKIIPPNLEEEKETDAKKMSWVHRIFERHLFPHVGSNYKKKAFFLGLMVRKLILGKMGIIESDDRDDLANKRIDTTGVLISYYFKYQVNLIIENLKDDIIKEFKTKTSITNFGDMVKKIKTSVLETAFKTAFSTGNWVTSRNMVEMKQGTSQVLQRKSCLDAISNLRRIVTPSTGNGKNAPNKKQEMRRLHNTHFGYICACETPEGHSIGLVKNLACTCKISIKTSTYSIRQVLSTEDIVQITTLQPSQIYENNYTKIFVDGDWYACTDKPKALTANLIEARRSGKLNNTISIIRDFDINEIRIYTDSGRCLRPLFIVDPGNKLRITKELIDKVSNGEVTWDDLIVKYQVIEYLSVQESSYNSLIALGFDDLSKADPMKYRYTHCEIHPMVELGVIAAMIPFADHNQGPRNLFTSAQMKQAIGTYVKNYYNRMDTKGYILYYPEKPLVNTIMADMLKFNEQPAGKNTIVAIMCYTGYNQEDSVIFNKGFIDCGGMTCTQYGAYKEDTKNEEKFVKPNPQTTAGIKRHSSYEKVNKDGFVKPGTILYKNDIIIAKVHKIDRLSRDKQKEWKDNSKTLKEEMAIVDRVIVDNNNEGYQFCKVRIRIERRMEIGDKISSRHGQKGTVGMIYRQEDMPFTESGLSPDIIVNPHALPSRMTIGQLLECILAKVSAYHGVTSDATPFNKINANDICDELEAAGFERYGDELMYSGFTSEPIMTKIFIGPTYYQRLQHIVKNKIHSRGHTGPDQALIRQPLEGRARDGGFRFGEMERDAMVAHGIFKFLKERFYECSDAHNAWYCDHCGHQAVANPHLRRFDCINCSGTRPVSVSNIELPYAMKHCIQEIMTLGIIPRVIPERDTLE